MRVILKLLKITLISLLIAIASCKDNLKAVTTEKKPLYNGNANHLRSKINRLIKPENFYIDGLEISKDKIVTNQILIQIINGGNIPKQQQQQIELAGKIANLVKNCLQDSSSYNVYLVRFVTQYQKKSITLYIGYKFEITQLTDSAYLP